MGWLWPPGGGREGEVETEAAACAVRPGDPTPGVSCTFSRGKGGREHYSLVGGLPLASNLMRGPRTDYRRTSRLSAFIREVCPTVRSVELAPGVTVTQACDGHSCLGVPLGEEGWGGGEPGVTVTQACDGHSCLGVPLGTRGRSRGSATWRRGHAETTWGRAAEWDPSCC